MKVTALVKVELTIPDALIEQKGPTAEESAGWVPEQHAADLAALLRMLTEERLKDLSFSCVWCEEAESERFLAGEGHDEECPFAQYTVEVDEVHAQWALRTVPVEVRPAPEDRDTAGLMQVAVCSLCGHHDFRFEESVYSPRAVVENYGHTVLVEGDGERDGDGDDLPGFVCTKCGSLLTGFGDTVAVDYV